MTPIFLCFIVLINLYPFGVFGLTLQHCPAGYYCPNKLGKVTKRDSDLVTIPCPAGTFSQIGQGVCIPCEPGYYANTSGSVSCTVCPSGFMCPIASQNPIPCELYTYSSCVRQTCCKACPVGTYTLQRGSVECINCPSGSECPTSTVAACGGDLLSPQHQALITNFTQMINPRWQLLYKATRDGFSTHDFHRLCDNQLQTVTIIQSKNGYLFGGYAHVAWYPYGSYSSDPTAFIFTLTNPNSIPPTRYPIKDRRKEYAIYGSINYGPTFGEGHDITVSSENNGTTGYTNFGNTYNDTTGKGSLTFTGNFSFETSDVEVYKLFD